MVYKKADIVKHCPEFAELMRCVSIKNAGPQGIVFFYWLHLNNKNPTFQWGFCYIIIIVCKKFFNECLEDTAATYSPVP